MKIIETEINKIESLRKDYFESIPEFQELFLEIQIPDSKCFLIKIDDQTAGYLIISSENILLEYYLTTEFISKSSEILKETLKQLFIENIFCKSFDALLLSTCMSLELHYEVVGYLFRDYYCKNTAVDEKLSMKPAEKSVISMLYNSDESIRELFENEKQISNFTNNENVFLFFKEDNIAGCGTVIRTVKNRNYCDLGIWTAPEYRKQGIGTQIILSLREFAVKKNMIPSCGCDANNIASKKTIEKSGFASRHRMIEFEVSN